MRRLVFTEHVFILVTRTGMMVPHVPGNRIDTTVIPHIQAAIMTLPDRLLASCFVHILLVTPGRTFALLKPGEERRAPGGQAGLFQWAIRTIALSLAWGTMVTHPNLVELVHDASDHGRIVRNNA